MAETYQQAIAAAKRRYAEAMDEVAWDVLAISEKHDRPLKTVCKDIAGEGWIALESAARRRQKTAGQTADELRRARDKENRRIEESKARAFAKRDPDAAARMVAKVAPAALVEAAAEAQGRTRTTSPTSNVEGAFGPREFNRLEDAVEALIARLPDLATNAEDKKYARDLADKARMAADLLDGWAEGQDVGQEAEEWLNAR